MKTIFLICSKNCQNYCFCFCAKPAPDTKDIITACKIIKQCSRSLPFHLRCCFITDLQWSLITNIKMFHDLSFFNIIQIRKLKIPYEHCDDSKFCVSPIKTGISVETPQKGPPFYCFYLGFTSFLKIPIIFHYSFPFNTIFDSV